MFRRPVDTKLARTHQILPHVQSPVKVQKYKRKVLSSTFLLLKYPEVSVTCEVLRIGWVCSCIFQMQV